MRQPYALIFLVVFLVVLLPLSIQQISFTKPWVVIDQISVSYNNLTSITLGDGKIDTKYLEVSLENISNTYGLYSSGVLNIGGINSVGSVVVSGEIRGSNGLVISSGDANLSGVLYVNSSDGIVVYGYMQIESPSRGVECTTTTKGIIIYNKTLNQYEFCSYGVWNKVELIPKGMKIRIYNPNPVSLSEFQVKVNISKIVSSLGTNFEIYTSNGAKVAYCFVQQNGECESTYDGVDEIWLRVPLLYGNENTYLAVRGTSSTSGLSGKEVFDLYDNFKQNTIGTLWYVYNISGELTLNPTSYVYINTAEGMLYVDSVGGESLVSLDNYSYSRPFVAEMKWNFSGIWDSAEYVAGIQYWDPAVNLNLNVYTYHAYANSEGAYIRYRLSTPQIDEWGEGDFPPEKYYNLSSNTSYIQQMILNETHVVSRILTPNGTLLSYGYLYNTLYDNKRIGIDNFGDGTSGEWMYVDWIRIRKYANKDLVVEVLDY